MNETVKKLYADTFGEEPHEIGLCPYRICPLGAHCDHQHGIVTGFAIDMGIHIAYSETSDGSFDLLSANFPQSVKFRITDVPAVKQNDWADYLRGALIWLNKRHSITNGLRAVISGSLPIGGLSSSAAVVIAFLIALCRVNGIKPTKQELIEVTKEAENNYVGVGSGTLDQSCELLSKKDKLLYLDTLDGSFDCISAGKAMPEYKIAIFCSGVERTLVGSKYNMRVDECRAAAYALKAYSDADYGKFNETFLRDVPEKVYEKYGNRLPDAWHRRAEHWYSETQRVREGVQAWENGDLNKFGKLMFESGRSSIESWEAGSPELKTLYELMLKTDGIYGGRFSGAGFKGCCIAIADPSFEQEITKSITEGYLKEFPALREGFSVHFCDTRDGAQL